MLRRVASHAPVLGQPPGEFPCGVRSDGAAEDYYAAGSQRADHAIGAEQTQTMRTVGVVVEQDAQVVRSQLGEKRRIERARQGVIDR